MQCISRTKRKATSKLKNEKWICNIPYSPTVHRHRCSTSLYFRDPCGSLNAYWSCRSRDEIKLVLNYLSGQLKLSLNGRKKEESYLIHARKVLISKLPFTHNIVPHTTVSVSTNASPSTGHTLGMVGMRNTNRRRSSTACLAALTKISTLDESCCNPWLQGWTWKYWTQWVVLDSYIEPGVAILCCQQICPFFGGSGWTEYRCICLFLL